MPASSVRSLIKNGRVAVIGVGGVGSYVAEAIVRSGIEHVTLIDADEVCGSNTNRQLQATLSNVGKSKVDALRSRFDDINPNANVDTVLDFVVRGNVEEIIGVDRFDVVVECTDNSMDKAAICAHCAKHSIEIVTVGGAAGRVDPTQIKVSDLSSVRDDKLLFWTRKRLRKEYGFTKGPKTGEKNDHNFPSFNIHAVHSNEKLSFADSTSSDSEAPSSSSLRYCDNFARGTTVMVTGSMGFVAASKVLSLLALNSNSS
ncbi:hypothetical protein ScalyP_jg1533 [Parmales sp. scaly parma]|nr:hypothetical protein ScalyP_jg1533 [Parmales sp. scaly parma]